jgi:hypothetical protein
LRKVLKLAGVILLIVVVAIGLLLAYWLLRPNTAQVSLELDLETWPAVADGEHNSNTDLIYWQDAFYLVYASSPFHFASAESSLHLLRSEDARTWEEVARFDAAGEDIRDPKLAPIGDRLFLYALKNTEFTAEPYQTVYAASDDARTWTPFRDVQPEGWLFWRPKRADDGTWYTPAYWHEHGRSVLLRSTDGVAWTVHSPIHEGDRNDETAVAFLPDGQLIATARLEMSDSWLGHPEGATLIAVVAPPFEAWTPTARSTVTRLDGPALFAYRGRIYAVGRYQPRVGGPFSWQGSIFSRKRTALFLVEEGGLAWLSDLPSAGDTSYAGVVVRGDDLYISYYTSGVGRDYPWVLGMVAPSDVMMARVGLESLAALAGDAASR